jgi:hypothetical protein
MSLIAMLGTALLILGGFVLLVAFIVVAVARGWEGPVIHESTRDETRR